MGKITNLVEQHNLFCLISLSDDDLNKIFFVESENNKGRYFRVIATAFGSTSCSCIKQTRNPYTNCEHMKVLDQILLLSIETEQQENNIQRVEQVPKFIFSW
jgi:hypothetical protein